ncbi:MAG TPA: hypothetical protein VFK94_06300, partial [Patescibacteria group bacterium]|nr:hypothetical protein [Patescibacteria group bacterium]
AGPTSRRCRARVWSDATLRDGGEDGFEQTRQIDWRFRPAEMQDYCQATGDERPKSKAVTA